MRFVNFTRFHGKTFSCLLMICVGVVEYQILFRIWLWSKSTWNINSERSIPLAGWATNEWICGDCLRFIYKIRRGTIDAQTGSTIHVGLFTFIDDFFSLSLVVLIPFWFFLSFFIRLIVRSFGHSKWKVCECGPCVCVRNLFSSFLIVLCAMLFVLPFALPFQFSLLVECVVFAKRINRWNDLNTIWP